MSALPAAEAVVTASAGNHGLGVAWAATALGRRATVVVPENASPAKLAALERFDVALERVGSSYDDAERTRCRWPPGRGLRVAVQRPAGDRRAGDDRRGDRCGPRTAGSGGPAVVAPLGGGGLASGLGLWSSARAAGRARVVAVEAEHSQAFRTALDAGAITPFAPEPTIADGLGGNLEPGSVTFELVRDHVDAVLASPEPEIEDAIRVPGVGGGLVAEGAAACAAAAVLAGRVDASRSRRARDHGPQHRPGAVGGGPGGLGGRTSVACRLDLLVEGQVDTRERDRRIARLATRQRGLLGRWHLIALGLGPSASTTGWRAAGCTSSIEASTASATARSRLAPPGSRR